MKLIRILLAAIIAVLGATAIAQVTVAKEASQNPNDASYWESRTEHPSVCYKHDPPSERNSHGYLTDGNKAVKLNQFDQSWPGDHWELLVVKSGSVDYGDGAGNKVYKHPTAGTAYYGPLNDAGQQGTVSHWIVCKGTTPQTQPTQVSWTATDGTCDATSGVLAMTFDPKAVEYAGDAAGTYAAGTTVNGTFTAKQGYSISGPAQFSHTFAVTGSPCVEPPDLQLNLTAECASGDTLYWRVTNDEDVAITFTWDGPGSNDGSGVVAAGSRTYFTTTDAGGPNTTTISWSNPSGGPSQKVKAHNNTSCMYHVSFEKSWNGDAAPDLDGAVLLTATSSVGSATCTSDGGVLSCTYEANGQVVADLYVPFGETYSVDENVPAGWYTVSGIGSGFTGIEGFDDTALPDALVYDVADDRFCSSNPEAASPKNLEKYCTHVVANAPTDTAPAPQFVDPTCADRDVAIVDPIEGDGITYEVIDGEALPGRTVTVQAVAGPGVVLEGPTEWTHTFGEVTDADCVVPGTPSSSIVPACGAATLTFTNTIGQLGEGYTGGSIDFTYTVDGEPFTVTVAAGASKQVDLVFGEDTGTHTVVIGDGQPYVIDTNCEPETVEPAAPQFVDPTCDDLDGADIVLPTVQGVTYVVTGTPAGGANVTVTATAEDGFVLQGTTEWQHTFADVTEDGCTPPVEPAIEVAAFSPVCQSDIPYIDYSIEVSGTDADRATLTFIDNTGKVIRTDTDMPLSGRVVYPGAAGAPNPDWPGWTLNGSGLWVPDPTDANWREGLTVRVDVNPTAFGEVTYPEATEVCYQPPTNASSGPTTTVDSSGVTQTTTVVAELPKTGSNGTSTMVTLALALMAVGALLAGAVRVRRPRLQ